MTKESNTPRLIHLLHYLFLVVVVGIIFLGYFREISAINQDLGRHLLTGQLIWESQSVPTTNLYSYTFPDFPFINHHWLSEVIFYLVHHYFGFLGLLLFTSLLMVLSFGVVLTFVQKKTALIPLLVTSFLYLAVLFERTDLRPEILSYFYLSLFVVILFAFRERFTKWIYLLPLLSLLWVNSHIYFPIGLLLIFLFFLDSLLINRKEWNNRQTITLVGIGIVSGLTTLINPHFLTGALYPLTVFTNYGYTIEENQTLFFLESLGFAKPSFFPFKIAVFLLFSTLLLAFKKTRPIDWLLAVVFSVLAFSAVRNFPLFVFATFIPLSFGLTTLYHLLQKRLSEAPLILYYLPSLLALLACGILLTHLITTVSQRTLGPHVPQGASKALTFVEENNITGPIFNNFDIGSYITYRLYPKEKIFIDGRPEAYPEEFIQKTYIPMQEDPQTFANVEEKYHFNSIVFSHTDQTPWAKSFLQAIMQNQSWVPLYLDPMIIILVKDTPHNQSLIKEYGMNSSQLTIQNQENSIPSLYQSALFFQAVGLKEQEQELYRKILTLDPRNCPVIAQLALSENQQNPLTIQRFNLYCQ